LDKGRARAERSDPAGSLTTLRCLYFWGSAFYTHSERGRVWARGARWVWHCSAGQAKESIEPKEGNEFCTLLLKPKEQICP